ncbi:MAG: hypothetical protein OEN23_14370 [Paracoccaceae bacterium]|nr:hypothetical protein [Paracoccaceae bacterium]
MAGKIDINPKNRYYFGDFKDLMLVAMGYTQKIQSYFQPDIVPSDGAEEEYRISRQWLAFGVGFVAFGLPIALLVSLRWGTCFYDSISHFYYSRVAGDLFVGALFFIGTFLLAYRGEAKWENRLSKLAGFCAFGVAVFPTSGVGCERRGYPGRAFVNVEDDAGTVIVTARSDSQFQLFSWVDILHFGSALALFATLAFFCFFVFTRVLDEHEESDGVITKEKARRNAIYHCSGWAIVGAIAVIGVRAKFGRDWMWWDTYNLTFVFETIILWAFGLSWAVKGRFGPARDTRFGRMLLDKRDYWQVGR